MENYLAPILIAESGTGYGGTAKYLHAFLSSLDRDRFAIKVVAYGEGPFISKIKAQGWPVEIKSAWRFGKTLDFARLFRNLPSMVSYLKQNQIRLIHLNNEIYSHLPLILAGRLAGCRLLCHLHGWRKLTRLEKIAARWIDRFVSVTFSGADFYRMQLPGAEIRGVPNGLLEKERERLQKGNRESLRRELHAGDHEKIITLIGRVNPLKGQEFFLKALDEVRKHEPVRGLMIGTFESEDYRSFLESEIDRLNLRQAVHFMPWTENIADVYAASDIVVQPSTEPESFGLVLLEAMAAGRPVVASRLGGMIDVVSDGETGLLIPPKDAGALAAAVLLILRDETRADEMKASGKKRAKLFSMEKNTEEMAAIYWDLLDLPKHKRTDGDKKQKASGILPSAEVTYAG